MEKGISSALLNTQDSTTCQEMLLLISVSKTCWDSASPVESSWYTLDESQQDVMDIMTIMSITNNNCTL